MTTLRKCCRLAVGTLAGGWMLVLAAPVQSQSWSAPTPGPGFTPHVGAGKTLYDKHCAMCHGSDLRGSGKGPPLLHRVYEPSHHADFSFQLAARNGVRAHHWQFGNMPPIPAASPDDVANITAYVRAEQRKAGIR